MSSSASIRLRHEIQPGDIGEVVRLHGMVYAQEHGWDHTFEGYVAETMGRFGMSFDPARDRLWIAEAGPDRSTSESGSDASIAGTGPRTVGSIAIVGQPDGSAQLRWFVVHPDARGHGLGRRMLTEALAFCRARKYPSVSLLTVRDLHTAAHLYADAGFELIEETTQESWGAVMTLQTYMLRLG